jgi:hypothetical protein
LSGWLPSRPQTSIRLWRPAKHREPDLATDVAWLKRQLDDALRRIAALEARDAVDPTVDDPAARWVAEHRHEAKAYRGRTVAIHSTRGIVASGDDVATVAREVERMGLSDEVLLDVIPSYFE